MKCITNICWISMQSECIEILYNNKINTSKVLTKIKYTISEAIIDKFGEPTRIPTLATSAILMFSVESRGVAPDVTEQRCWRRQMDWRTPDQLSLHCWHRSDGNDDESREHRLAIRPEMRSALRCRDVNCDRLGDCSLMLKGCHIRWKSNKFLFNKVIHFNCNKKVPQMKNIWAKVKYYNSIRKLIFN